jgi:hypothetical protein
VNKANELMWVIPKYSAKCYNHKFVSHLGYRHLSPVTPHASTLGETSPASQVLPKGPVFMVLLVHVEVLNPGFSPMPTFIYSETIG